MNRFKREFINIFLVFVWDTPTRRRLRQKFMDFHLSAYLTYVWYRIRPMRHNSVLLIEFNDCHGEVMGGIIPYFQKLGYNIDVLINAKTYSEHPFCRQNMRGVRVLRTWTSWGPAQFIHAKRIAQYKHVVMMTSACYWLQNSSGGYVSGLGVFDGTDLKPFIIEHDLNDVTEFGEEKYLQSNHLITLGKFDRGIFVNPHKFGHTKINPKNKKTTFITVGNIESKRKNHKMLIDAIENLAKRNADFRVIVIGNGNTDNFPAHIRPYIEFTGRLNFPKMFNKLESADFFLPLLDAETDAHNRYITTGVTGSAQLIYGFAKIPVIHKKFANFYRFDDTNAIVYENDFANAMMRAIQMTPDEYATCCNNLQMMASKIADESYNNLERILNEQ